MLLQRAKSINGFTLIEMVIVVTLVALLASMAVSSYQSSYTKTRRSAAQQFMMQIANKQEQYFLDARSYTTTVGTGGLGLAVPAEVSPYYTVTITTTTTPPAFTVTASPQAGQASDGTLVLNSDGSKTPTEKW
jgi:type IV pilus assembly protein PilE